MLNKNKIVSFLLIFLFISSTFITIRNTVSASELVDDLWSTKTPMSQARADLGVVAVDGKIYAIGGYTAIGHEWWGTYPTNYTNTNERYDPATNMWTTLEPMPTSRANFAIIAYQSKIYCIGGESIDKPGNYNKYCIVEVYDTVTNSWSTKNDIPFDGLDIQVNIVNGKIFAISGYDLFMYDSMADKWTKKTSVPLPDDLYNGFGIVCDFTIVLDNKIMVYFRYTYALLMGKGKVMIYDNTANVWSEGKPQTTGIYGKFNQVPYGISVSVADSCITTGTYAPKKVYVWGLLTAGSDKPTLSNWAYDPVEDTWLIVKNMSTYRAQFGVAVVNDIIYVVGGKDVEDAIFFSINEQYVPKGYTGTISPDTTPTAPTSNSNTLIIGIVIIVAIAVVTTGILITKKKQK